MKEITADIADKKITDAARQLTDEIWAFNKKHPGPDPLFSPDRLYTTLASSFSLLLADRYAIVPPREFSHNQF